MDNDYKCCYYLRKRQEKLNDPKTTLVLLPKQLNPQKKITKTTDKETKKKEDLKILTNTKEQYTLFYA